MHGKLINKFLLGLIYTNLTKSSSCTVIKVYCLVVTVGWCRLAIYLSYRASRTFELHKGKIQ